MTLFGVRFWPHVTPVGAIRFEDRFCDSRKVGQEEVGGSTALSQCMVAVTAACRKVLVNDGPFVCFHAQMGVENAPFTLKGHSS